VVRFGERCLVVTIERTDVQVALSAAGHRSGRAGDCQARAGISSSGGAD
jgi:hypothetical protein